MAVFTPVSEAAAQGLLAQLSVGPLVALAGIESGIENTNYFVTTPQGEWVLTLFERLTAEQLPFYLGLMRHLAGRGQPVPNPQADAQGRFLHSVAGKPAALVQRLPGQHQLLPDRHHCQQLGATVARLHVAVADFSMHQPNLRGLPWCLETAPRVVPYLSTAQATLLADELAFQQQVAASPAAAGLPQGAVHADLFRDNVLFDGLPGHERLTACFDFYFAGIDSLVYDLAVCLNDWCLAADGAELDDTRANDLVAAYVGQRPLSGTELRMLPAMLRRAALRFWLSRLSDWHLPRSAALLAPKDPTHFERVLRARVARPWHPGG